MLMRSIEADIQTARAYIESFQAQADRQYEATRALIESFQAQVLRQHEDLIAFLREMDRRRTEIMARLGELLITSRK